RLTSFVVDGERDVDSEREAPRFLLRVFERWKAHERHPEFITGRDHPADAGCGIVVMIRKGPEKFSLVSRRDRDPLSPGPKSALPRLSRRRRCPIKPEPVPT